jgi:hypothetical protein
MNDFALTCTVLDPGYERKIGSIGNTSDIIGRVKYSFDSASRSKNDWQTLKK